MREEVPAWPPAAKSFNDEDAEALRRSVHGGSHASWTCPDDDDVVLLYLRNCPITESFDDLADGGIH